MPKCAIRRYYTGRSNCPLQIRESGPQSAVSFFSARMKTQCARIASAAQNVYVVAQANSHIAFVDSTSAWRRGAFWPENYDLACPHPICHYTHYTPLRERGVQPRRSAAAAAAPTFLFAPLRRGVAFEHNFPRAVPSGLLSQWKCAPRTYRSIWNCLADEGIASFRSAPQTN
jgi:hypothetical protein